MEGFAAHDRRRSALVFLLAILTAMTLQAVFRFALRQAKGLIGSIIGLLGLALRVLDHTTLSRRAATLKVPPPHRDGAPMHLLVDSTGLKLCGAGEWLIEKHGKKCDGPGGRCTSAECRHRPDRHGGIGPERRRRRHPGRPLALPGDGCARLAPEACSSNSSAQPAARKTSRCGSRSGSPVLTRA